MREEFKTGGDPMKPKKSRIAIIGCEGIDPIDAFSLAKNDWLDELVLIGEGNEHLEELTLGLLEKWAGQEHAAVRSGVFPNTGKAEIAILNSAPKSRTGECESERLNRITKQVRSDIRSLVENGFKGVLVVTSTPVDVLSFVALQAGGFEPGRIIGLPTNGDIANGTNTWCSGKQGKTSFLDHCDPNCAHFEQVVHLSGKYEPADFHFSGNRIAGMALCVTRICEAVVKDEHELLPVSAYVNGEYELSGIFLTVPCLIGRNGVERIVNLPVTRAERFRMLEHAAKVQASLEKITNGKAAAAAIL
jgi:L-lactate dehydrogenase